MLPREARRRLRALVGRDERTGLYWSDCYDSSGAQDNACDTINNTFNNAITICTADQINGGACCIGELATTTSPDNAITFCRNLSLDADGDGTDETDWRLPTQKELMQAYINGAANNLPHPAQYFWSATEKSNFATYAWYVAMNNGATVSGTKSTMRYAMCVR